MTHVSSSKLKAHLGRYLRTVRRGAEIVITDREQPVARLVPYGGTGKPALCVSQARDPAAPALGDVTVEAIAYAGTSTTEMLLEDRGRR